MGEATEEREGEIMPLLLPLFMFFPAAAHGLMVDLFNAEETR